MNSILARIPIVYSTDDSEWLIDTSHDYNYKRCDCHDLLWHYRTLTQDPHDFVYCELPPESDPEAYIFDDAQAKRDGWI